MTAIKKSILKTLEDILTEHNIKIHYVSDMPHDLPSRILKQEFGIESPHFTHFFEVVLVQYNTNDKSDKHSRNYNSVGDVYFWKDYGSEDALKKNVYFFINEKYTNAMMLTAEKFERESGLNSNIHIISSSDNSYA